jgi:uracil-DNA glycosylase
MSILRKMSDVVGYNDKQLAEIRARKSRQHVDSIDVDRPKSLGLETVRVARTADLLLPHSAPLAGFAQDLRAKMGLGGDIPHFDPWDGGVEAECLFLLEAPGSKAVRSGFVSRDNPDESAKNFFLINQEAGIDRKRVVVWNVVPWYLGDGRKIRAATTSDISAAEPALSGMLQFLGRLRVVVLVGKKAARARETIESVMPKARIFAMPHPSPMFVNRSKANRAKLLDALLAVATELRSPS